MTPDVLLAIFKRDAAAECVDPYCHQTAADRRALIAELRKMTSARIRMESLAEAEHIASHAGSRTERAAHKAAANAYEIALNLLTNGADET
jgi:hypothetical protein